MTTDDTASSGKSATKESSAEAIRKAREGAITGEVLTSVRREIQSLAATMGGVSLSLLELQTSAKVQSETAEQARQESLAQMRALTDSAKTLFSATANVIERYPAKVDQHLATLSEESERRARLEKWKLYGGLVLLVSVSSLSAWGGWKQREKWSQENPSPYEQLARYVESNYPEAAKKYWKAYQGSLGARRETK